MIATSALLMLGVLTGGVVSAKAATFTAPAPKSAIFLSSYVMSDNVGSAAPHPRPLFMWECPMEVFHQLQW